MALDPVLQRLYSTDDASVWAEEFCKVASRNWNHELDEGWVTGWFANAIETAKSLQLERQQNESEREGS